MRTGKRKEGRKEGKHEDEIDIEPNVSNRGNATYYTQPSTGVTKLTQKPSKEYGKEYVEISYLFLVFTLEAIPLLVLTNEIMT